MKRRCARCNSWDVHVEIREDVQYRVCGSCGFVRSLRGTFALMRAL